MTQNSSHYPDVQSSLPEGERLIWQGRPTFKGLALRAFHIREVGIYFGLILMWRLWSGWSSGISSSELLVSALWIVVPAVCSVATLALLAWLFRRATTYTVTSKRILLQFGVALPMTMNIPLGKIKNAALKTYGDASGDIPLKLADNGRASFVLLWPHIRPWRLQNSEPMLRSIPDAAEVAARLAEALSGQPGPSVISLHRAGAHSQGSDMSHSPTTVAA